MIENKKIKSSWEKTIFIAVLVLASLLVTPTFAACTNVCSTESQYSCTKSVSTLTKGTSSTLTVTITNKQSQAITSLPAQLLGSWFTASSSSTTISSIQGSGGTASADFSITPTAAGGQDVCVALGSTCTADCGTVTVNSAAELSVLSITAPSSASTSTSFTVSATIQNAGTETAGSTSAVTATLSSSQCTVSSGTKTVGTVTGSGTSSVSWTVTAPSSATTCSFSLAVSGTPGGTATGSKSVTITGAAGTSGTSDTTSAGGGGGAAGTTPAGTKVTVTKGKATITIPFIAAQKSALVEITKSEETNVNKIAIVIKNAVNNLVINIEKVTEKPSEVSQPSAKVYHYIKIDKVNLTDANVNSATIDFQVEKSWISANNIDDSTIALNRFSNGWQKLVTTKLREDAKYVYLSAQSPGLSVFAITAAEKAVTATTVTTVPGQTTTTAAPSRPVRKPADNSMFVLLAGFVIVFALAFFLIKKKKGKHSIV